MNCRTGHPLFLLALLLAALNAGAHEPFDGSTRMTVRGDRMELEVTFGNDAARQVLSAAGFSNGEISELFKPRGPRGHQTLPAAVAAHFFEMRFQDKTLSAQSATLLYEGMEVIFTLIYPRPSAKELEVRAVYYDTIAGMRPGSFVAHDESAGELGIALLSRGSATARLSWPLKAGGDPAGSTAVSGSAIPSTDAAPASAAELSAPRPTFAQFFQLGVEHILIGFDHLLFLLALLVGVRKPGAMLGIITCFTLAHSVTLALAALNVVMISSRVVEPLIAASIIVVCVENLFRGDATADRFWLAGGFGLIHGFGFAGVLRETGLGQGGASIAMPLCSFNLGVEAGQLAVAAVFLPALFLIRKWTGFARYGTVAVSAGVILVSGYWLLERTILTR